MSTTRVAVRINARTYAMDTKPDGGGDGVGADVYNLLINSRVQDVMNEIPTGAFKSPSLVTLVQDQAFYSLGAAQPSFTAIGDVIYRARGRVLVKSTIDKLERRRQGIQPAAGFPQEYAVYEQSTDNTTQMAFWPTPSQATISTGTAIDVYITTSRVNLASDADVIFFQDALVRAMEKAVAAEVIMMMPEAQRRVNPAIAAQWMADFERMAKAEGRRVSRNRAQRYVSIVTR